MALAPPPASLDQQWLAHYPRAPTATRAAVPRVLEGRNGISSILPSEDYRGGNSHFSDVKPRLFLRRIRRVSATDQAWKGQPVAPCGARPSAVSLTEPTPHSAR